MSSSSSKKKTVMTLLRSLSSGGREEPAATAAGGDDPRRVLSMTMPAPAAAARMGGGGGRQGHAKPSNNAPALVSVSAGSSVEKGGRRRGGQRRGSKGEGAACAEEGDDEDEDPFAGPFKVTVSTPGSGGKETKSTHSAAIAELLRRSSSGDASSCSVSSDSGDRGEHAEGEEEDEDDEDGEDDEEEEEEEPAFDPRKAHETFIMRALQGLTAAEASSQGGGEQIAMMSQSLRKKQLKWADEDGGELNNVQFFDKGAEPSQVLRMMLAADARAEGAAIVEGQGGACRAAMGREEIVRSLEPYLAQIKGHIQEVLPVKLMRNGTETRTVLITGKGPIRQRVGVAIVWMGGLVKHLKIMRNPEPEFLEDTTSPPGGFASQFDDDNGQLPLGSPHSPSSPSFRGSPSSVIRTPTSSESELLCLDPPYLVPRPATFPTPTLLVEVLSAHNLKSSAKLPRPVNPYVKLKLGTTELRTNVLTNTKNPVWGGQDATHSRFRFRCPDPNALLRVTVGDWKIGKNLWIARLALPLASIEITTDPRAPGVSKTYALRLRVSRFGKHIEREGASDAKLVLRLKYEHPERAWTMQELKARDDAWLAEEMEALAFAKSSRRRPQHDDPGAMAATAAATCALM